MNYGYGPGCKGWKKEKCEDLAYALIALTVSDSMTDSRGQNPYVEIDGLYEGVTIRRITHLTNEQRTSLVHAADEAYDKIILDKPPRPVV